MSIGAASVRARRSRREFLLWYGVLGAPLAWAAQLVIGYAFEEGGCPPAATNSIFGANVEPVTAIVIVVCGAIALGGILAAALGLRSVQRDGDDPRGRALFMAAAGTLGSALFLLAIILSGVALVPLDSCQAG